MDGVRLSRRSLVSLVAVAGLSGCSLMRENEIANDSYLSAMRKDPLYLWKPAAKFVRSEGYMASSDHLAGNAQSSFIITWTFEDHGAVPALLREAESVAREAGYVDDRRQLMTGGSGNVYVRCHFFSVIEDGEVIVDLKAPM